MAKYMSDSFLPSGAAESPYREPSFGRYPSSLSTLRAPMRPLHNGAGLVSYETSTHSHHGHLPPYDTSTPPIHGQATLDIRQPVPGTSRPRLQLRRSDPPPSSSTGPLPAVEQDLLALVEGWRAYTHHLRENAQGERVHMEADRARMLEMMAEERSLWDQERAGMKAHIERLESQIAAHTSRIQELESTWPGHAQRNLRSPSPRPDVSASSSLRLRLPNGSASKSVPQESGRNPDGSAFYAPSTRHPSRTFEPTQNSNLAIDKIFIPGETPLRMPAKELKQSDFGMPSPPSDGPSRDESVCESIDISILNPKLEGVPIKTSAVAPDFVAKVLSPSMSLSPTNVSSPPKKNDITQNLGNTPRQVLKHKPSTLEIIAAPENRRLTMNAGHTPNHSVHQIEHDGSGNITPSQPQPTEVPERAEQSEQDDNELDQDPELKGPLGLQNDAPADALFLSELTDKLQQVKESGLLSPSQVSVSTVSDENSKEAAADADCFIDNVLRNVLGRKPESQIPEEVDEDEEESATPVPVLRVKPSMNFGRPFGTL